MKKIRRRLRVFLKTVLMAKKKKKVASFSMHKKKIIKTRQFYFIHQQEQVSVKVPLLNVSNNSSLRFISDISLFPVEYIIDSFDLTYSTE